MCERKFRLRHEFKNFPEIKREYSPKEEHFGVPWRICVEHRNEALSVCLYCEKEQDANKPWSIDVSFSLRLVSIKKQNILKDELNYFKFEKKVGYGILDFHPWNDVVDNYMDDRTVTIECNVTIKKMTGIAQKRKMHFDAPNENLTDAILEVDNEMFHVSKAVLAVHSSYFNALFFGNFNESKRSEIALKELDATAFQLLLDIIYGEIDNIMDENVETLLKLADQFDVSMVRILCEKFLRTNDNVEKKVKLRLADKYNLENLKKDCIDSINSTDELREILPNNVANLSHSTLVAILEKHLTHS